MKLSLISIFLFGVFNTIQAQEIMEGKIPVDITENAAPMIEFFLKYDDKDSLKSPDQVDFDKMLNEMGIMDEVQSDNSGHTKEDAFRFIDAYIKADQGNKIEIDHEIKEDVIEYLIELENGKQDAENIFNQATSEEALSEAFKNAEAEVMEFQSAGIGISYDDFSKAAKAQMPDASEEEIKEAHISFKKDYQPGSSG